MSVTTAMWGLLAILVFWSIGAYNRLVRLRGRVLVALSVVEKQFSLQAMLLAPPVGPSYAAERAPVEEASVYRWSGLVGAGRQLEASLKAVRLRPLDGAGLNALRTAHETLVLSWSRCRDEPPDLAGSPLPEELIARWYQLMVQTEMARVDFNQAVDDYNRAVGQIPACVIAWLFGLKPTQNL